MYVFLRPLRKDIIVTGKVSFSSPLYISEIKKTISFTSMVSLSSKVYLKPKMKILKISGIVKNAVQSQKISSLAQESYLKEFVTLFTLDLNHLGMGTVRFTNDIGPDNQPISFGNKLFYPVPINMDGFEKKSQGSQARPVITLSAISPEITALLLGGTGLQGSQVTRIRTFGRFLDTGEEPDGNIMYSHDSYILDRILEWVSGEYVKFELRNALDLDNSEVPNRRISKHYCDNVYRLWNAKDGDFQYGNFNPCPYVDDVYYNAKNERVTNPHEDVCGKTVVSCEARFGKGNILPFGGFPGTSPQGS